MRGATFASTSALALSTIGCVVASAALAGAGPGNVAWAVVAVVFSQVLFTCGKWPIAVGISVVIALATVCAEPVGRTGTCWPAATTG